MRVTKKTEDIHSAAVNKQLKLSEEKFSKIYEANPNAYIIVDIATRQILDANEGFETLSGITRKEAIGKTTVELGIVTHDINDQLYEILQSEQKVISNEHDFVNRQKGSRVGLIDMIPITIDKSECALLIVRDITEKAVANMLLAERENELSMIFNASTDAMLLLKVEKEKITCVSVNQTTVDMMKARTRFNHAHEYHGQTHEFLLSKVGFSKSEVEMRMKRANDVIRSKEKLKYEDGIKSENFTIYLDVQLIPILNDNTGICTHLLFVYHNITEEKIAENEIKIAYSKIKELKDQLANENQYLREEIKLKDNFEEIVFGSIGMLDVLKNVEQVAQTTATVLILGETGTGKELIARAIHNNSSRNNKPLVKINCAALPKELIESELFGHEKGAFTGAFSQKSGRFELANGGSIFLDEIGELPLESQVKILRVLQEGEFERLGSNQTKKVDVRVIAATNRNLEKAIEDGNFRSDLFYRLNVFPIVVPPLKERLEDIPLLVHHLIHKLNRKFDKSIEVVRDSTIKELQNYSWPGNVRELENVIERAMILSSGSVLQIPDSPAQASDQNSKKDIGLKAIEREHITNILNDSNWKIDGPNGASQKLGLPPSTLRDKMKKLGIRKPRK